MKSVAALISGFVFAVGLVVSGMTDANKVVAFLDVFGDWDPSLAFVMVGAIGAFSFTKWVWHQKKKEPLFANRFDLPLRKDIGFKLVLGSIFFGAGWGLMGFCPGPALVSLATLNPVLICFVLSMIGGMALFSIYNRVIGRPNS